MLWVTKKKNGDTGNQQGQIYSNDIKDLLGAMNSNPCVQISMRGQDMNLLKSFIQEWINMYYERENGKVRDKYKGKKREKESKDCLVAHLQVCTLKI